MIDVKSLSFTTPLELYFNSAGDSFGITCFSFSFFLTLYTSSIPIVNNIDNSYTILFEQGKSTVKDITSIVNALKQNNKNITIIGNVSPEGSEEVNKALALARAKSVRNALIKAGISADRITITNEYANQRRATIIVH